MDLVRAVIQLVVQESTIRPHMNVDLPVPSMPAQSDTCWYGITGGVVRRNRGGSPSYLSSVW